MTIYWALKKYEDTGLTPEEIERLKEQHRWIPVEERLPEESLNSVIGWDEYRERCCCPYCGSELDWDKVRKPSQRFLRMLEKL